LDREQGMMELDTFTGVLDEIGGSVFTLLLWGWGEPFLNPRIFDMIGYAKGKGVKVISSTNGHLFARPEMADRVVRSGLDSLIFAVDGITQESYARFRQGGTLETALTGIRNVVASKRALGSPTPLVNFRFIVMAQNEDEIPRVKELAAGLGVDVLTFKTLNPDTEDFYIPLSEETTDGRFYVPRDQRYRRFKAGPDGQRRARRTRNPCKHLWTHPVVHWDGTVVSCSFDPDEQYPLGNVCDTGFEDVWNGSAYRTLRRKFRDAWQTVPRCCDCSYAWKGGSCSHESIAEAIFFDTGADAARVRAVG
jgi:radical SAM protein with 4Fe4S-binding SPASM domain